MRVITLPHDISVNVRQPYEEGQPLSALEAEKLNALIADNIKTALGAKLKRLSEAATAAGEPLAVGAIAAEFQSYADSYAFSVKRERVSVDPVTREAHKIAKEKIFMAIRAKGGTPSDYKAEGIAALVAKVLSSAKGEEILSEAKRRVEAARKIANDTLDDIFSDAAE